MEKVVKEICKYIIDNIDDEITLNQLEKEFYYTKYYITRIFKSYTGFTIKEFSNTVKILKTIDPLLFTDDTILKIALNNGFNSQEYYSEIFQYIIGTSPLKFRKQFSDIEHITDIEELKAKKEYLLYLKQYRDNLLNVTDTKEKVEKVKDLVA